MALNAAHNAYRQNSVEQASPGELTLMLYNGCIKFIRQAKTAMEAKDYYTKNKMIQKASSIIKELNITLDMQYDIAKQLRPLYEYMIRCLNDANIKNDPAILDEVEELITGFRDTWKEVIRTVRQQNVKGDLL